VILVVDASVAIKWFLHVRPDEAQTDLALNILAGLDSGAIELVQPPHFVAEVAAVLAREKPGEALADLSDLLDLEFQSVEGLGVYFTATELSIQLGHHLFDTLYHATALQLPDAVYVTADRRYYDKAQNLGQIVLLAEFALSQ